MSGLLDVALECVARGWHVFPCWPKTKKPMTAHGWHDATLDETRIRDWWTRTPDANVAIACGPSNLAVVDIDHGLANEEALEQWLADAHVTPHYAVRTGRRPEFGAQLYFSGAVPDVGLFKLLGCEGQVKSLGGYIMAAGSIHPDSGLAYAELWDVGFPDGTLSKTPDLIRGLRPERSATTVDDGQPITSNRNVALTSIAGRLRNAGLSAAALEVALLQTNVDRCTVPLDDEEVKRIAENIAKKPLPAADPVAIIGKPEAPTPEHDPNFDWRSRYLTFEKVRDAKPTEFLIDGFLALGSITALAAPVAQRKSLIALNVAHALCTGEPLFGYFSVTHKPARVVYLCPEMGLASFSTRLKAIGLDACIGESLFCQTMDEERIKLSELDEELPGAVVIIDTLTRFVDGDQNSSEAMSVFADVIFGLKRRGATVLLLHHSVKGASAALTLDSAMRGSTELAAFVTCCWATRLKNPDDPYKSPSLLVNVKQRDFESKPFEVIGDETCRMHIVGEPGAVAEIKDRANAEAEAALATILAESPELGINSIQKALKATGHKKGVAWVTKTRTALRSTGVSQSE